MRSLLEMGTECRYSRFSARTGTVTPRDYDLKRPSLLLESRLTTEAQVLQYTPHSPCLAVDYTCQRDKI
jgi:hypothetical protein